MPILPSLYYLIITHLALGAAYNVKDYTVYKTMNVVKAQQHHERLIKKGF